MSRLVVATILALLTSSTQAHSILEWVNALGANGDDHGFAADVDMADNVYVGGRFISTVDFDPGPGVTEFTATVLDPFLVKFDSNGALVWAKHFVGSGALTDLVVDGNNDLLVLGQFGQTLVLDKTTTLQANPFSDLFVAKFDSDGNLLWAWSIGGSGDDIPHAIAVDSANHFILGGSLSNTVDLDPGLDTFSLTPTLGPDTFLAKYDSNGQFIWGQLFEQKTVSSAGSTETVNAIVVDPSDHIFAAGLYKGSVDIDGTLLSSVSADAYLAKFSPSGVLQWANSSQGDGLRKEHFALGLDAAGNVYAAGMYFGSMDFDPNPMNAVTHTATSLDIYLASYDSSGGLRWVSPISGDSTDQVFDMHVYPDGTSIMAGTFAGTLDFDPGPGMDLHTAESTSDPYLARYDASGMLFDVQMLTGVPSLSNPSAIRAISLTSGGDLVAAGHFKRSLDFDPGPGQAIVTSTLGTDDVFLARYSEASDEIFSDGFEN